MGEKYREASEKFQGCTPNGLTVPLSFKLGKLLVSHTWLSRVVSACCCLCGESCNTLTEYRIEGKPTQIGLPVILTPPILQ